MKVLLIDGNNLLYRSYFATAYSGSLMKNSKNFPTNAIYGLINMLNKVINEYNPEYVMVAFDKGKTFRHDKYESYKGGREETPTELKMQFPISRRLCTAMGIKYYEIDNYEADDIIGTFAKKIDESNDLEGIIVSSDKDLLQLISDKVKVHLIKQKDNIINMDKLEFKNTYGLDDPKKMVDIKALMGDPSDNIPGVKGIGEKTAISLLQEFGSLENLYNNIESVKGKTKEKLIQDKDNAFMSYDIATIYKEVPIDTNLETIKYLGKNSEYIDILNELEFYSLLKKENTENVQAFSKEFKYTIVEDINKLFLGDEYSIYLETFGYNYHDSLPLGVSITDHNNNYFVPINKITKDFFVDGKCKYTYDLKKLLVVFNRLELNIDNNIKDLMIEAYLINKNVKNDIAYIANNYDYNIEFYEKTFGSELTIEKKDINEIDYIKNTCLKSLFIYEERNTFYKELINENMERLYLDMELPLVYVLADMEETGFKVDINCLLNMGEDFKNRMDVLEKEIYSLAGHEFNINSPKQLGDILFNELLIPYPKKLKKDESFSTSKDILDKVDNYEIVKKILEYKSISKIVSTYIEGIRKEIKSDSCIHTIYNQTLTRTGRLSSERPNLQNIPIRQEEGRLIRKAFVPRNGSVIISSDYSQIELRVFASMANATNMIDAFNNDLDIHARTASEVFNKDINDVTKEERRNAKAVNFGIIYGISSFGLSEDLGINVKDASEFINKYLDRFPEIKTYMDKVVSDAHQNGYVKTLFNRKRVIEELNNKNYMIRQSGERMAMNAPIQGTAADIIKMAMIELYRKMDEKVLNSKMLVQVHDELVFDVPINEVEIMKDLIKETMENIVKLEVPLKVELEYGKTWYEAK